MTAPSARVRACLPFNAREYFDPGGTWGYPLFNSVQELAQAVAEYVADKLGDDAALVAAALPDLLRAFDDGGSLAHHRHLTEWDSAADDVIEFIANHIDGRPTMVDEQTQTNMPTEPPPASTDGDTIEAARTKAAIAILTSIEAVANHADVDANKLERLATAYRAVTPRRDEPIIGQIGTTLEPIEERQLNALSGFFEGVRHVCGLPGTRMTPERIQETVEAVTELRRKGNAYSNIRSELQAANEECASLREQAQSLGAELDTYRKMLADVDGVCQDASKQAGIGDVAFVGAKSLEAIERAYPQLDVAERAQHINRLTSIEHIAQHHKRVVDAIERVTATGTPHNLGCRIQAAIAKMFRTNEESNKRVEELRSENETARAAIKKHRAQVDEFSALLQKAGEEWTGRTFVVDSHGSRKDALGYILAAASEARMRAASFQAELEAIREQFEKRRFGTVLLSAAVANVLQERDEIRDALTKDGFTDPALPQAVECALDSLIEARKERDAANIDRSSALALLESNGITDRGTVAHGVRLVLEALAATSKERDAKARQYRDVDVKLTAAAEKLAALQAELGVLDFALQNARKWTGHDFDVNSHGRRMDMVDALVKRAELWRHTVDALRGHFDELSTIVDRTSVAKTITALVTERDEVRAALQSIDTLLLGTEPWTALGVVERVKLVIAERDRLQSNVLRIQEALGSMPPDMSRPPSGGSVADVAKAVAALVAECQSLTKRLATSAISQPQEDPSPVTMSRLLRELVGLIDYWRRGAEPFRVAATDLEKRLKQTLGATYWSLISHIMREKGTNEIGAIIGVARETIIGVARETIPEGQTIAVDMATGHVKPATIKRSPLRLDPPMPPTNAEAGPFSMSEGHETSREAIDAAAHRAEMPNIFDCGCSKHKVTAGRCDVYDASGKPRAEKPTPPEATRLQPPVFGKGSF